MRAGFSYGVPPSGGFFAFRPVSEGPESLGGLRRPGNRLKAELHAGAAGARSHPLSSALLGVTVALLWTGTVKAAEPPSPILLRDVSRDTGIQFVHQDGSSGRRYIVESVASGLATFDYDRDGDLDIYFLNGAPLPGTPTNPPPRNALYRNDGGLKFTDVTDKAGVGDTGYGLGVCAGDYDNDGDLDLYVNNFGPNVLYRNNGDGTFTDVTQSAGVANGDQVGAGACFLDMDGDGDLDLFVANYINFTLSKHQTRHVNGHPAYVGPMAYGPVPSTLFRNNGNGSFTDVSKESGIGEHAGTGMGVVCADYDDDGDTDIIVGNDAMANFVWNNDGKGHFKEVGLLSGLAYDLNGIGQGTMGIDCGDYDNDGRLDFHMTSYQKQWAILYKNIGRGMFDDVTHLSGAGGGSYNQVEWGNGLVDFDNDGHRDLFMACGHLQDNVELWDDTARYEAPAILMSNTGRGKFVDVSSRSGDGLAVKRSGRGVALDDLDNDGDIDVVILNSRREPTVLRNDSPRVNHWLGVRLQGSRSNRDGIGARIKVVSGDLTLIDEVHSGRGYQSHFGMYPHFGLGTRKRVDRVEVRWIGGGTNVVEGVEVDRVIEVKEAPASP
ncbi:MAG: CRTAC1 family protein [Verrucomicrobiales bacterium]|nr:CRTAC1 family protein [Verrucomicrobiales bacterium]